MCNIITNNDISYIDGIEYHITVCIMHVANLSTHPEIKFKHYWDIIAAIITQIRKWWIYT